jgi:GntR family transcriptional regulator, transcriptional repressor for pyruvate dehydrogenase complex
METVTSALYDARRTTVERSTDLRESAEMHREIYRAIRARKPEEARKLMEDHLRMAQTAQSSEQADDRKAVKPRRSIRVKSSLPLQDHRPRPSLGGSMR